MSSNSKESRRWMRGGYHQNQQSNNEGGDLYCSSPSDTSLVQSWTPPPPRRVNIDDFEISAKRGAISGPLSFTPTMEGTSKTPYCVGSTSSQSDGTELEHSGKLHLSTPRIFPSRRSFMSKPIHPFSFPFQTPAVEPSTSRGAGLFEYDSNRLSTSSSSIDLADISEQFESNYPSKRSNPCGTHKCGVCDRLLSQRSPWSSRRIFKSEDMPVTGVLFCHHVFHAECLEQTTPKSHSSDPSCPICAKVEGEYSPKQYIFPGIRNSFPRLRTFSEDGPSRSWGCVQVVDCVEGALLNWNKIKKNSSLKGNSNNDFLDKPKKTDSYPLKLFTGRFVDHGKADCSTISGSSSMKK